MQKIQSFSTGLHGDVLRIIFSQLTFQDLMSNRRVCKGWNHVIADHSSFLKSSSWKVLGSYSRTRHFQLGDEAVLTLLNGTTDLKEWKSRLLYANQTLRCGSAVDILLSVVAVEKRKG